MIINKNSLVHKNNLENINNTFLKNNKEKWKNLIKKNNLKDNKLKQVSQEIESIFIKMIYKEMKKGLNKTGILKINQGQKIFSDMLLEERSKINAKYNPIGLSQIIYNRYKNTINNF